MRIYLDNAATSWPKPEPVYAAVERWMRDEGASAGRGAYREAQFAQREVDAARRGCAQLLGADDPDQVVFGGNATDGLNLAIFGLVRPGDRVLTTVSDHNSVLRPLATLGERAGVEVVRVPCDGQGFVDLDAWRGACRRPARLAAFLHGSNVTGAVQPVAEMAALAREAGALVLVDAAQSVGHLPVDVAELGIDLLAASGHKGLLGPAGAGFLWICPRVEGELSPHPFGRTGARSDAPLPPTAMPQRFEAGSLNVPALAGIAAACEWLAERGVASLAVHEAELTARLLGGLESIDGVRIIGPPAGNRRAGVVSFTVRGYDPQEFAAMLDATHGVQCRAGLHCAPLIHRALGTHELGGAVRMSVGWSLTLADVDAALAAVDELAAAAI